MKANQQDTPRPTVDDAMDAVDRIRRAGVSLNFIVGRLCDTAPAAVVQAVEEIQARRTGRTEET